MPSSISNLETKPWRCKRPHDWSVDHDLTRRSHESVEPRPPTTQGGIRAVNLQHEPPCVPRETCGPCPHLTETHAASKPTAKLADKASEIASDLTSLKKSTTLSRLASLLTLVVVCIVLGALPHRSSAEPSVCGQETWYTGYEASTSVTF